MLLRDGIGGWGGVVSFWSAWGLFAVVREYIHLRLIFLFRFNNPRIPASEPEIPEVNSPNSRERAPNLPEIPVTLATGDTNLGRSDFREN